jgi:hypothetical protein
MRDSIEFPTTVVLDKFETAAGNEIPNFQQHAIMDYGQQAARWTRFKEQYKGAKERSTYVTGIYNCHGFVFAAGRTGITHGRDVRKILNDDGYQRIMNVSETLEGDVVLYVSEDGDVEHSGILVLPLAKSASGFPVVVSKWGDFVEYVHELYQCPYSDVVAIEYWRIMQRPRMPTP